MTKAEAPTSIKWALYFALAAYGVGLVVMPSQWSASVAKIGLTNQVLLLAIPLLLFVTLYFFAYRRKNWARVILLVLLSLSFPGYALSFLGSGSLLFKVTQSIQLLLFGGSFMMFLTKESRNWYRSNAVA